MLVDKQDRNVLALLGEAVECGLDGAVLRLCVNDEEVLLCVGGLCHVLQSVNRPSSPSLCPWWWGLTPTPASSMPVTVSYHVLTVHVRKTEAAHLISNHGDELPVLVL